MRYKTKYSTLVELMILTPLFTFGIYVAIYFGECVLIKINGAISSRYVSDSSDIVTTETLKDNFIIERGKSADLSEHYWVGNKAISITKQEKTQGLWPVSESGVTTGNVIHQYFIEFGFDINVSYEVVGDTLQRKVTFTHQDGGLDLMRYQLYAQADDVVQKLLQERITYSNSRLEYNYENNSPIPSAFDDMKENNNNKTKSIALNSESRSMILLNNTLSRNFYKEMTSINRLTNSDYDSNDSGDHKLTDERVSEGSTITNESGGNSLNEGSGELYWSSDAKLIKVRDSYPVKGKLSIDIDTETEIAIEEMEKSYLEMEPSLDTMVITKDAYIGLGF